jgi:outer membrane protein TolC
VSLEAIPEESQPVEALVQEAFQQRPELEQAVLTLRNDEITLKGARNALLPAFDVFGYYQGQGIGGKISPNCNVSGFYPPSVCNQSPTSYGTTVDHAFNNSAADKGLGFTLTIPIRNREAQSVQERSLMEYRQAELRLEQLRIIIRMQVVNAMFALNNDRAQVRAAVAARDYAEQSFEAEQKKLHLGASTTANVLQQERSLAGMEDNLIAAHAAYAKDRSGLYQTLASTLQHYDINLTEAASGTVTTTPAVPGVEAATPGNEPTMTPPSTPDQPAAPPPAQ